MTKSARRIFCVFLGLLCVFLQPLHANVSIQLNEEEVRYLSQIKSIKLCVGPNSMPLDSIEDGRHIGINSEYMRLFAELLATPIQLVETQTWQESLEAVKQGKCDILALAQETPQRSKYLTFTNSYLHTPFVIVTTQEKFFVSKLTEILDQKLAVHKGYAFVDLLKNRYPQIQLLEVESNQAGVELVNQEKIFGYLSDLHIAGHSIQIGGYTNLKINGQFDELATIQLGIGVNHQHLPLVAIFNKAIDSITPQQRKQIENSWITVKYEMIENYQHLIQLAIFAGVILLFLGYRQYHLRQHYRQLASSEKEIWQQANFDFLTSLPNRRFFQERLKHKIQITQRSSVGFTLLLIDLDGFKEVNDTLGHNQGDRLLQDTAERIKNCLRSSDTLARLGGDEFVVILQNIDKESAIETVVKKLLTAIKEPYELTEKAFISASIGITVCPKDATNVSDLIKNADQAMYAAKALGRNTFHYFKPTMQTQAIERMQLIKDLRIAIEEQQFEVFYQPIINLSTGKIVKAEALIRWHHPTRGFVSPVDFIPTLEETRMINEVGEWIFLESARQVKIWRKKYDGNFQISVNTSPIQFQSDRTKNWESLLANMQVSAVSIGIEITESMMMEGQENISKHLLELRDAGFQVSLDDFGTGYSSLSYLKKFDIDFLKIDQSFVRNLSAGSNDMVLCEAIIVMAHKLGLEVIAEGVENSLQQKLLTEAGCDFGQGYLFAKPMPAKEFEQLFNQPPF